MHEKMKAEKKISVNNVELDEDPIAEPERKLSQDDLIFKHQLKTVSHARNLTDQSPNPAQRVTEEFTESANTGAVSHRDNETPQDLTSADPMTNNFVGQTKKKPSNELKFVQESIKEVDESENQEIDQSKAS